MAINVRNPSTAVPTVLWEGIYNALTISDVSMPAVIQGRREFMKILETQGEWPERLLHVPSMVSYPRTENNFYGGMKKPDFTILSYKWGLWVVKDGLRLEIKGIPWETPAIDPKRWTIAQLQEVIKRLAQDTDFVWIDVACIDQFLEESTLREIKREPQVFRQAKQSFIWFVDFDSDILELMLNGISEAAEYLLVASMTPNEKEDLDLIPSVLTKVFDFMETMLSSPWFRSNWTLREIILCENVTILNREGKTVPLHHKKDSPAVLDTIATVCATMLAWLQRMEHQLGIKPFNPKTAATEVLPTLIPSEIGISKAVMELGERCLRLLGENGPFFLYSSLPETLYFWTAKLLATGVLVIQGQAGEEVHESCWKCYHSWGDCYRLECSCLQNCECTPVSFINGKEFDSPQPEPSDDLSAGDKTCIPCILNISYPVGDVLVGPRTKYQI